MSNPLNNQAISCKKWGKRTTTRNLWFLAMLWYTAFHFFILTGGKDIIETYNQSIFHQYSGLISITEIIIIIAVWLCPLIWIIKSYNLLLKYRPNDKFFVKKGWIAGILRCTPIVCLCTKYRILKDLYFNLTEEKNRKKKTFYTRYTFYLLAWGFFIIYSFVSGMFDTNLLEMVKINSLITSLLATIAISTFNNIVGIIGNFYDTFNIVKGVKKRDEEKNEKNTETVKNETVVKKEKTKVRAKNINYKKIIFILLIVITFLLLMFGIVYFVRQGISKKQQKESMVDTIPDLELFELNQKCNELYKDEYLTGTEIVGFDGKKSMLWSAWSRDFEGEHLYRANNYEYYIFYSPIEKSCVFSVKQEWLNCSNPVGSCENDEDLSIYDYAEVKYFIEIIRSESKRDYDMLEVYCFNPKNPGELFSYCGLEADLSKYKDGFFGLIKETRKKFENEIKRLEGK